MKTRLHILLLFVLLSLSFTAYSQEENSYYKLEGKVVDSLNRSIPYANVLLRDTTTSEIMAFAVTDESGSFKMTIAAGQSLQLKASFVGFVPFVRNVVTSPKSLQSLIIPLSQDRGLMDEVQVVKVMPVTMSGDTLTYKTEAFTRGNERKLEDVLKQLPGVEVAEDGSVKVQGKKVDKLLVEGKQFFDGDSKMAVKNLPAKAIDKVQVLKNYQDNASLSNVSTNETLAMNITLKEDQKSLVFGDISLGVGEQESYTGHGNSFYYSEDLSVNAIVDANNVGKQAFSYNDFRRMQEAQNPWGIQSGALKIEQERNSNSIPSKDKDQVQFLRSNFLGLNLNFKPSARWQHQAYTIGNTAVLRERQQQQRRFLSEQGPEPENSITDQDQDYSSILGQYQLDFVPSPFSNWQYKSQWLGNENTASSHTSSNWAGGQLANIDQQEMNWSWNQQLNFYTQITPDHVLSLESQFLWNKNQSENLWDLSYGTESEIDSMLLRNESMRQDVRTLQSELHYYWIWNRKNHLDISFSYQSRSSNLLQSLTDETGSALPDYAIDFGRNWSNTAVGLQWKTRLKSFLILPGLSLFNLTDTRNSISNDNDQMIRNQQYFLPKLRVKYDINSVQGIDFSFTQQIRSPQSEWLTEAFQLRNYQNIVEGNALLRPAFYNSASLDYHFFNFFNGMNAFLFTSFNQVKHSFQEATSFDGAINNSNLINSGRPQYDLNFNGRVDKRFKKFRLSLESNGLYQSYSNIVNALELDNEQINQRHSMAFETNLGKIFTSSLRYAHQLTDYSNGTFANQFSLQSLRNKWEAQFTDHLEFSFDLEYQLYEGTNTMSDWWLANSNLSYKLKNNAWRFDLSVSNIFNTQSISRDYLSEYFVSTYQNFIQGRRALIEVNYNF